MKKIFKNALTSFIRIFPKSLDKLYCLKILLMKYLHLDGRAISAKKRRTFGIGAGEPQPDKMRGSVSLDYHQLQWGTTRLAHATST